MKNRRTRPVAQKVLFTGDDNQFFYFDGLYDRRGRPQSIWTFMRVIARNGDYADHSAPEDVLTVVGIELAVGGRGRALRRARAHGAGARRRSRSPAGA